MPTRVQLGEYRRSINNMTEVQLLQEAERVAHSSASNEDVRREQLLMICEILATRISD